VSADLGILVGLDLEKPIPEPRPDPGPGPAPTDQSTLVQAIKGLTPALIVTGIVGGATIAIGAGLVNRYMFR
jgi:hypothetical protein